MQDPRMPSQIVKHDSSRPTPPWFRFGSLALLATSIVFLPLSVCMNTARAGFGRVVLPGLLLATGLAILLASRSILRLRMEHQSVDQAFLNAACESTSIFQTVLEGILILDDYSNCLDANPAVASILRISRSNLIGNNFRHFFADSGAFAQNWKTFLQSKNHRGRAELVAGDGVSIFVDFTAAADYLPGRHVFIFSDATERISAVTARKYAEMQMTAHLEAAQTARAEAEALRKSTLALSQNLTMDFVLDTLLQCISELVPFDTATVLFAESKSDLMVARRAPASTRKRVGITVKVSEHALLQRILIERKALLLPDTRREADWRNAPPFTGAQSWLGIPLAAAGHVLGILSLEKSTPYVFTAEHLRLAKALAIPAAVAIQNARTHERAEIYATELEVRLRELRETQKALENLERKSS